MESELRGVYCPAELEELEITLLTQLLLLTHASAVSTSGAHTEHESEAAKSAFFSRSLSLPSHTHTHTPSLTVCLSFAGVAALDAVNLEDRIVWQLVTSVLAHRRAHYAKRVDNLRLFVRTGLFKTYRLHSISLCIFAGHLTVIL